MSHLLIAAAGGIGQPDPEAPTRSVNDAAQAVVTIGCWVAVAAILFAAYRMSQTRRSTVPVAVVFASAIPILGEPLWDSDYHLYWYRPGQWVAFTSFGISQPWWVVGVYPVLYAGGGLYIWTRIEKGATRQYLYGAFAVATLGVGTLETSVTSAGVYRYYGYHPFKILHNYPVWCAVMEGAHIAVWSVLIARIGPLLNRWRALLLLPLFFFSFATVMYGAAFPALYVINADVPRVVAHLGAVLAVGLACATVFLAGQLLPSTKASANLLVPALRRWADAIEGGKVPATEPAQARQPDPALIS
jgi:hypothetical protein